MDSPVRCTGSCVAAVSAARSYTLRCSGIPPTLNARLHHMERYRLHSGYKNEIGWQARSLVNKAGGHEPFARAQVCCVIHIKNAAHMLDTDNAYSAVKPLVDALKGVMIVDDNPRCITLEVRQQLGDQRGVTIEVRELLTPVP